MKISRENLPKNKIELTVEFDHRELTPYLNKTLKKFSEEKNIPGFRPGKVPENIIKQHFGEMTLYQEAAQYLIEEKTKEILSKENLSLASLPQIEILKLAPENPFCFKIILEKLPEIKLKEWQILKFSREKIEINPKKIDQVFEQLRENKVKEVSVNRPAKIGDRIEADLKIFLDKVPLENGQIKNGSFVLGKDHYIPGFSAQLEGLSLKETKNFSLPYPENFYDKNLAGRKADFKIKVNNIFQRELPDLNDQFAQGFGQKNLNDLKEQIRKNLEEEEKNHQEEKLEIKILDGILNLAEFEEIPESLIENEIKEMIEELKEFINKENLKFEDYLSHLKKTEENLKKDFLPKAEKRIKIALIIQKIAGEKKIAISDQEVNKEKERLLELYKNYPEVRKNIESESYLDYLKNLLINRKVIEYIKNKVVE